MIVISSSLSSWICLCLALAGGGGDVRDVPDDVEGSGEEGDDDESCRVDDKIKPKQNTTPVASIIFDMG